MIHSTLHDRPFGVSTITAAAALWLPHLALAQDPPASAPAEYAAEQADRGRLEYQRSCALCHGENLDDGQFAQPLTGVRFRDRWAGQPIDRLFTQMRATMPPDRAGGLPRSVYADLIAYLLQSNGVAPSERSLPDETAALAGLMIPGERSSQQAQMRNRGPGALFAEGVALPEWPAPPDPLDRFTPVTDEVLASPPPGSWLHWRGTYDALGYSPLDQIDKGNVERLRVAWTLSLPPGPNESTPLVHAGVMFVHSYGDHIQALDAATGDELWHYARELPEGVQPGVKRNIAIYGNRIYAGTSDGHVVALDATTGRVAWDVDIGNPGAPARITGGPLVARGKVMQGVIGRIPGGAYLQARRRERRAAVAGSAERRAELQPDQL